MAINVNDYPYGRITKTLRKAVKTLNVRGRKGFEEFDFPDYANLPNSINSRLGTDEVDFIQDNWHRVKN